ncbi:MAG: O-linked N-acetylglucosamine transferase, SPINDLY family protein [Cyanobacteriota bacterium]|jgi:predicted O-linked N-acetylglucosamine transferase (SPINDLY family)
MTYPTWPETLLPSLEGERYEEIAQFYEAQLEQDPQQLSHYWRLGLAYLLMGEEEQAQLTWFVALQELEGEALEAANADLIAILDQEANRLETLERKELAWLVRGHLRELAPADCQNLLKLIQFDLDLKNPTFSKFEDWQVVQTLTQYSGKIDEDLLLAALAKVASYPALESVDFTRAVLVLTDNLEKFSRKIIEIAGNAAFDQGYPIYSADLVKVCLEKDPDNLVLIKTLYWFYAGAYHHEEALEVAKEFAAKADSLITQVFASYLCLNIYLMKSDWLKVIEATEKHKKLLLQLSQEKDILVPQGFISDSLLSAAQVLIYVNDNPQENHYFNNFMGSLFCQKFALLDPQKVEPYNNLLNTDRPLKIGYIGHTFRNHSVGWLCRWLIRHHNRELFKTHLYVMGVAIDDPISLWFREHVDQYSFLGRNVAAAVRQIQADEIDILIDVDSLTLNVTYQVMVLKPAPVQATWLGQDAGGIPTIDYFIADPYVLPPEAENCYSEKIWRLPHTYLGIDGFEIGVPTLRREDLAIPEDSIIYMNFQGALKRYPDTIRLQFRIVNAVPNSYFVIKGTGDKEISEQLYKQLAIEEGFPLDRIRFIERDKTEVEHRANLQLADVVLDTYPYNGATTTLEVLWSGIPLVTKVGKQFAARNSYTFMINAGITEGIAWTDEEYIDWGVRFGMDENLRQQVSWKLRQSRKNSPLWNGKQFARDMEDAYRQMWELYCKEKNNAIY